jgi:hypothetical protein
MPVAAVRCALFAAAGFALAGAAAQPLCAQDNGTYSGKTDQGPAISIVVTDGMVTKWDVHYSCHDFGFTGHATVSTDFCPIRNGSFRCGRAGCGPFTGILIAGTFSGDTVSGLITIDSSPFFSPGCCSLHDLFWSATRGGDAAAATPNGLTADAVSDDTVGVVWNDNSNNEMDFRVEMKEAGGDFAEVDVLPADTSVAFVSGLDPATTYTFRVRARSAAGFSPYSNQATATTFGTPGPCLADGDTLCLNGERFQVEATWETATASGKAQVVKLTDETGYLWFFSPSNVEAIVKVLAACPLNQRFWVFAGGLTDVRTVIAVIDSQTGAVRQYINPQGTPFQPIQDTDAFANCP